MTCLSLTGVLSLDANRRFSAPRLQHKRGHSSPGHMLMTHIGHLILVPTVRMLLPPLTHSDVAGVSAGGGSVFVALPPGTHTGLPLGSGLLPDHPRCPTTKPRSPL